MVKKMHGQFFFQLSTLKCLFLKFRFLIMILLLCFCLDDSISMGLVSSSSVSSGLRAWRQSRAQGSGKNQAFQKWLAPRNHYTSIQMGGAWRAVLGKVHLRECWRKAGLWNAYSHMPDDDEPVPGGHRWDNVDINDLASFFIKLRPSALRNHGGFDIYWLVKE